MRRDTLRLLDVAAFGLRLVLLLSRVPRRPLLSVQAWRHGGRGHLIFWKREVEDGL